jgi:hypothetical protein
LRSPIAILKPLDVYRTMTREPLDGWPVGLGLPKTSHALSSFSWLEMATSPAIPRKIEHPRKIDAPGEDGGAGGAGANPVLAREREI